MNTSLVFVARYCVRLLGLLLVIVSVSMPVRGQVPQTVSADAIARIVPRQAPDEAPVVVAINVQAVPDNARAGHVVADIDVENDGPIDAEEIVGLRVEASRDLRLWQPIEPLQIVPLGTLIEVRGLPVEHAQQFFRISIR